MPATTGTDPAEAARRLTAGQLVALPTETVYGLGANGFDTVAVSNLFAAKDRPRFDPLILHQHSAETVLRYARSLPAEAALLTECWPGPLTLVLEKRAGVPDLVTAGLPTVALRVPAHPLMRAALAAVDFPVAAPSANPFGFVSPVTARHVADRLGDRIDYILDGGRCTVGVESTIVGFPDGQATILRKGGTPVEDIESLLGRTVTVNDHGSSRPTAPGMLLSHYSPGIAIELVDRAETRGNRERAVVRFGGSLPTGDYEYNLSEQGDLAEAARELFPILRQLASGGYASAVIERVPERGLGRAINDRLRRAAY